MLHRPVTILSHLGQQCLLGCLATMVRHLQNRRNKPQTHKCIHLQMHPPTCMTLCQQKLNSVFTVSKCKLYMGRIVRNFGANYNLLKDGVDVCIVVKLLVNPAAFTRAT